MEDSLLTIGAIARLSGLPVSALRFYDGAGVLAPASVDPRTGYRRYAPDQVAAARLVARLRRVGMPLDSVRALLAGADPGPVLDAHLARLEDGLVAARRELSAVRTLLDRSEPVMHLSVPAVELAAALDAVRYAVGADPARPALHGVLLDASGNTVHVVATDRYRLAVVALAAGGTGRLVLPVRLVDEAGPLLAGVDGDATITGTGAAVEIAAGGRSVRAAAVPDEFPDWRRLEPAPARHRVSVDGPAFRAALAAGPATRRSRDDGVDYDSVVLTLAADGTLSVGGEGDALRVGVNREFLLDALADTPSSPWNSTSRSRRSPSMSRTAPTGPCSCRYASTPDRDAGQCGGRTRSVGRRGGGTAGRAGRGCPAGGPRSPPARRCRSGRPRAGRRRPPRGPRTAVRPGMR